MIPNPLRIGIYLHVLPKDERYLKAAFWAQSRRFRWRPCFDFTQMPGAADIFIVDSSLFDDAQESGLIQRFRSHQPYGLLVVLEDPKEPFVLPYYVMVSKPEKPGCFNSLVLLLLNVDLWDRTARQILDHYPAQIVRQTTRGR